MHVTCKGGRNVSRHSCLACIYFSTTFTPGPNNITATTAGVTFGVKRSLPYLWRIALGFFLLMIASGYCTYFLRLKFTSIAVIIKYLGFAYMLWLCVSLFIEKENPSLQ